MPGDDARSKIAEVTACLIESAPGASGVIPRLEFSFDYEGAARVFRFMDGMYDLYASFLDDRAASDLRGHPLGKVREVLASESLWRLSLNGNPAPGRRTIRTFPSRSSPSAGTFHLRQTSTCSGVVWFWIMLRSIWKDWLVPVAVPLVAALIGWRIDSTSGQGFAMVVSVVPKLIMAAVAGLMAFGLLKGAEWVGPILVSRLLGPQFRFVVGAIESRVKDDAHVDLLSIYRTSLEWKRVARSHADIRDPLGKNMHRRTGSR